MNIFLSWKALKTLWQRRKYFQMLSAAADVKTSMELRDIKMKLEVGQPIV